MAIDWPAFAVEVRRHRSFVLTTHVRPDCDALGSELGMLGVLEALGKSVRIANPHATPPNLAFIDAERRIGVLGKDVKPAELAACDALMVLDTSSWGQLGEMANVLRNFHGARIVLDHHQCSDDLGAAVFRDVEAEATGRLVVNAADALGVTIDARLAVPLFAALATDTGWFRFGSTTSGTYQCAARLVTAGANPSAIYRALYEQDPLARIQLRGRILSKAATELNGRLIYSAATLEDFSASGALQSYTEDVINQLMVAVGVEAALLFTELSPQQCKVSFRSRGALDCSALAGQFGGGGHVSAAGATIAGKLADVQQQVLAATRAAMSC